MLSVSAPLHLLAVLYSQDAESNESWLTLRVSLDVSNESSNSDDRPTGDGSLDLALEGENIKTIGKDRPFKPYFKRAAAMPNQIKIN